MSSDLQGHPGQPPASATPANQGRSGLAIAGFILAFLLPPLGLILCLIGMVQAGKSGQKGKVLAGIGMAVSLVFIGGTIALVVLIGKEAKTLADPGCSIGKSAILDNADKAGDASDITAFGNAVQATIDGLDKAAAKAKDKEVRTAMKDTADAYRAVLEGTKTGNLTEEMTTKMTTTASRIDELCTIGGAE